MRKRKQPAHAASQAKPSTLTVANPDRWDRSHGTYLSGRAAIDGADAMAVEMERYWGAGRLRLLVSNELRERFDRQRYLFNAALQNGNLEEVVRESNRMVNAWKALNHQAIQSGAKRADRQVLEIALDNGMVLAVVPNEQAVGLARLQSDERQMVVYTMEEIARLLKATDAVLKAKRIWPGAVVEKVTLRGDPLDAIGAPTGLDTAFDDAVPRL